MGLDRIRHIKEKISVLEYAQSVLGLPVRKSGDRCVSLAPGSHNPTAMVIYTDWWYDFKQGCGGDVIDLCAEAKHGGDKGAAIRELGGDYGEDWKEYTQNLISRMVEYHHALRPEDIEYLHSRGINDETIKRNWIGYHNGRLYIAYLKNGYIAYYASRDRTGDPNAPKYKKAKLDGYNENIPWGLHTLDREGDVLVIAEGMFDALSFEQEGYKVLSPIGGYFSKESLKQVINIAQNHKTVFVCFDSDEAGNKFTLKMAQTLFKNRVNFVCGTLPQGVKDVSDYYAAGGDLAALVSRATPGISMLAQKMTDREDFKEFLYEAARWVDGPELAELVECVHFPKAWLNEVVKQALRCPPESMIAQEVCENRRLKYVIGLGFYEYTHGVWKRRDDVEICAYIGDQMGHWKTGGRVKSILTLVKAACVCDTLFNKLPIFNFSNGVLELETGEFKEHSEAFMSSMQVDYSYKKEADCPRWRQFIEEVTDGNKRRMDLLQEIAGYVLFTDNSLQKCFFLMGDGANGKSVFLDVLAAVFGEGNTSNVEMSGLVEPFQRIHLLNSIVNISSETHSNVKGSEAVFKQIVVGDAINGCYKNKDFITFRPRTKFITACNEYIKAKDTTSGFMRRICFISFPVKFEGARADKDLTRKLLEERAGIFSWAYTGYKVLCEKKEFTVTEDQAEMMEAFTKIVNPLAAFIEENPLAGAITRTVLYDRYVSWCKDAGHESMSRTRFIQHFRATARQMGMEVEDRMSCGVRSFVFG
ncbi:MAG: toprim domain-containing protein [Fretibacterium sp.]|nr:toprim domain-containing protein [Fretibacterium sp.]